MTGHSIVTFCKRYWALLVAGILGILAFIFRAQLLRNARRAKLRSIRSDEIEAEIDSELSEDLAEVNERQADEIEAAERRHTERLQELSDEMSERLDELRSERDEELLERARRELLP